MMRACAITTAGRITTTDDSAAASGSGHGLLHTATECSLCGGVKMPAGSRMRGCVFSSSCSCSCAALQASPRARRCRPNRGRRNPPRRGRAATCCSCPRHPRCLPARSPRCRRRVRRHRACLALRPRARLRSAAIARAWRSARRWRPAGVPACVDRSGSSCAAVGRAWRWCLPLIRPSCARSPDPSARCYLLRRASGRAFRGRSAARRSNRDERRRAPRRARGRGGVIAIHAQTGPRPSLVITESSKLTLIRPTPTAPTRPVTTAVAWRCAGARPRARCGPAASARAVRRCVHRKQRAGTWRTRSPTRHRRVYAVIVARRQIDDGEHGRRHLGAGVPRRRATQPRRRRGPSLEDRARLDHAEIVDPTVGRRDEHVRVDVDRRARPASACRVKNSSKLLESAAAELRTRIGPPRTRGSTPASQSPAPDRVLPLAQADPSAG